MAPRTPGPYGGNVRKLVLAFDVGTTFSGVSYCVLDPGTVPELKSVTKYPGQDHASGSSKIPSVLYYDAGGNMVAAGAEALAEDIYERAADEDWQMTEWRGFLALWIRNGLPKQALEGDNGVIVVDAGGGTIDISAYTSTFQEAHDPSVVNYLAESQFVDDLDHIIRCFDKTTKLRFRDRTIPNSSSLAQHETMILTLGIKYGQCEAERKVRQQSEKAVDAIVLYHQLADSARELGCLSIDLTHHLCVQKPKAVADGALSFYLDHLVTTSRGVMYDALNPEHFRRRHLMLHFNDFPGHQNIHDYFRVIVPFNSPVSETKEFKRRFIQDCKTQEELATFKAKVYAYRGVVEDGFVGHSYIHVCTIMLNLSHLTLKQKPVKDQPGKFLLPSQLHAEMKAQVGWMESGSEKRSEARIVYTEW
ncbi:hypothetical protein BKA70DRAFT_1278797 [Coprinopsis sp. MPI-PUGE-AT-0042]|nr:hypothetical protein BKA70DRAFT_1278797 [Coprinopsis sp. MPI-PUGE-AT-0042]